jgi:hypothetical protein
MLTVFLLGTGISLFRAGSYASEAWFEAVVSGLFALVVFQFTVGNVWGYAVEYRNAGGRWSDSVFVAPFAVATLAAVALAVSTGDVWAGVWLGFWVFVVAAGVVAAGVWFAVGYRRSEA